MMMKLRFLILALAVLLVSCSNGPKTYKIAVS